MKTSINQEKIEMMKSLKLSGLSYRLIAEQIKCSIGTVKYHLDPNFKESVKKRHKMNTKKYYHMYKGKYCTCGLSKKVAFFFRKTGRKFTTKDLRNKLGDNPMCYLTGIPINLDKTETYQLDHIMPRSRGGDNSLENCGLVTKEINLAKSDKTPEEFIALCRKVVERVNK